MAEVTRCVLDENSQTSKAETKLKVASHCMGSISSVECVCVLAQFYKLSCTSFLTKTLT